jgi:hypothetical protein
MKLIKVLHENYGGPGELVLPDSHQAGMRVTKGGSMCPNCEYWEEEGNICNNKYWKKWSEVEAIPYPADEYCCNWWEPAPKEENDAED